jgi:hypothetical protein
MTDDWTSWSGEPDDLGDDADTADLSDLTADDGGDDDLTAESGLGPADPDLGGGDPDGLDTPDLDDDGSDGPDGLDGEPATAGYDVNALVDEPYDDDDGPDATDGPDGEDGEDGEDGMGPADAAADPVGADPDVDPYADGSWPAPEFPATLDLGVPPEPVDGFPWIDPGTLGDPSAALTDLSPTDPADPSDLTAYAALDPGADPAASDDPATAALAKFWELG